MALNDENEQSSKISLSKMNLFGIYLKAGRKRLLLTFICSALIFLMLTTLCMFVYIHRFQAFQTHLDDSVDWLNDEQITISSNKQLSGNLDLYENFLGDLTSNFTSLMNPYVPEAQVVNHTTALSLNVYTFDPTIPGEPWVYHEIMALEDGPYDLLNECLVEGRMPQKANEIICYRSLRSDILLNDTITIFPINDYSALRLGTVLNFTVVGIVDNFESVYPQAGYSADVFNWYFEGDIGFYDYFRTNSFFLNFTTVRQSFNDINNYYGVVTYLVDCVFDLSALKFPKLSNYINGFPKLNELPLSHFIANEVKVGYDIKEVLTEFSLLWESKITSILSINAPLIVLFGIASIITLQIGSSELEATFRRMRLYGLNYNFVRKIILAENSIITFSSLLTGFSLGIIVSYISSTQIPNSPPNFFGNFLSEPLLLISLGAFLLGLLLLSYFIKNAIAKKSTETTSETFKKRRQKIKAIFTSNEFQVFIIGFIFSLISLILHFSYTSTLDETTSTVTNGSYSTIFWFLIMISAAFLLAFTLLMLSRLFNFLWTIIGKRLWQNRFNLTTLSVKHISISKKNFQLAMISALLFGLLILPGLAMTKSVSSYNDLESQLTIGFSDIAIKNWADPDDLQDVILDNIS
ncbi:MAG: hypothetical protein EU542_08200, partial [Promethearchaeota archaeon]